MLPHAILGLARVGASVGSALRKTKEVIVVPKDRNNKAVMTAWENSEFEREAMKNVDSLYRTARRMTRNEQDAEDLVQETYFRAFRSAHTFRLGTNMRAWLFRILHNTHVNMNRAKWSTSESSIDDLEEFYLYNRANRSGNPLPESAEDEVFRELVDSDITAAIEQLPPQFRIAVLLCDVEGLSYREIADVTNVPIGTVMSRLSRGRRLLQKELWQYSSSATGLQVQAGRSGEVA